MPRTNLLPWREARRQTRQKQFFNVIGASLIVVVGIVYLTVHSINGRATEQSDRNAFLKKETAVLDKQIKEIAALQEEREKLLTRREVIQQLQMSRAKLVGILDSIAKVVPEGVHLEQVTRRGDSVVFNGLAQSNARVSVFMRQLDENAQFTDDATLNVVQSIPTNDEAIRKFIVSVTESSSSKSDDNREQ